MDASRYALLQHLFDAALARPPDQRADFLRHACGADAALYERVATLLAFDAADADDVLSRPLGLRALLAAAARSSIGRAAVIRRPHTKSG